VGKKSIPGETLLVAGGLWAWAGKHGIPLFLYLLPVCVCVCV